DVPVKTALVIEKDEIESCQPAGHLAVVDPPVHDWRQPLVERGGKTNLPPADFGGYGVWAKNKDDRVGLGDQSLDALPPVFQSIDITSVNQCVEAARL